MGFYEHLLHLIYTQKYNQVIFRTNTCTILMITMLFLVPPYFTKKSFVSCYLFTYQLFYLFCSQYCTIYYFVISMFVFSLKHPLYKAVFFFLLDKLKHISINYNSCPVTNCPVQHLKCPVLLHEHPVTYPKYVQN